MSLQPEAKTWFDAAPPEPHGDGADKPEEFERLWRGFMTARVMLGLVLLLLQAAIYQLGSSKDITLMLLCAAYCAVALMVRLKASATPVRKTFDAQWFAISGVDIVVIAALQLVQGNSINYAPLFALPILMTSVLGSLLLSLAGAAAVTLLLLLYAAWMSTQVPSDAPTYFLQAALSGAGGFVIAFLGNQILTRLANVELRALRNQAAVQLQRQVNELVIETLADGVLVLDPSCSVWAANPAARRMLGAETAFDSSPFNLTDLTGWQGLVDLMRLSLSERGDRQADVTIHHAGQGPRSVRVRTQLIAAPGASGHSLCVMFLQDQREIEARMRTEKLASMGRLSAAVAHEIRNPLSAIVQANALLDEDIDDPRHKQLTQMVMQNAKRLERIAEEVLDVSRVQRRENAMAAHVLELSGAVMRICRDWQKQTNCEQLQFVDQSEGAARVRFELEHLRRILLNLLENAHRYSSARKGSIVVDVSSTESGRGVLRVWSDGEPLDRSVQRHLFEPFFSSESRSSGLGLYICRELCEEQGALIAYFRTSRQVGGELLEGNEFRVTFQACESDQRP